MLSAVIEIANRVFYPIQSPQRHQSFAIVLEYLFFPILKRSSGDKKSQKKLDDIENFVKE